MQDKQLRDLPTTEKLTNPSKRATSEIGSPNNVSTESDNLDAVLNAWEDFIEEHEKTKEDDDEPLTTLEDKTEEPRISSNFEEKKKQIARDAVMRFCFVFFFKVQISNFGSGDKLVMILL
jgi:hypothetical protein